MNLFDFIKPRDGFFFNATYRKFKDSEPQYFTYKEITNPTERFSSIVNNLMNVSNSMIIQTVWDCNFEINGLIATQDGYLWQIQDIQEDCKNSRAVGVLTKSPQREFTIGLVKIDNPMELR